MSARARFILILAAAAVIFNSLFIWFLISFNSRQGSTGYVTFFIFLVLVVAPIYPLSKGLRKRPLSSAVGILFVIASGICAFASIAGRLVFHLDAGWASKGADLSMGLAIASFLSFIWSGLIQKNRQ